MQKLNMYGKKARLFRFRKHFNVIVMEGMEVLYVHGAEVNVAESNELRHGT